MKARLVVTGLAIFGGVLAGMALLFLLVGIVTTVLGG